MEVILAVLALLVVLVLVAVVVRSRRTDHHPASPTPSATPVAPARSGGGFRGDGLGARFRARFAKGGDDVWGDLETLLLKADVGPKGAADLVQRVRASHVDGDDPLPALSREIRAVLGPDEPLRLPPDRLGVVLVVGVNGSGKTTTIGKLATALAGEGRRVSLAAADTFRAAAGEQLEVWADRAGAHLVGQDRGADPGAVVFDAVTSATARGSDVLLVDTAGRLHTKVPLMDELAKLGRVVVKAGAEVDETLLVLDAQTGQNGIAQARAFTDAVGVTGAVLTKTDGSAKGGIVLAVREELGIPVRYVGVGEGPGDLVAFSAEDFTQRLLGG